MEFKIIMYAAIIGYVYAEILIKEGHILHIPFLYLEKKLTQTLYKIVPDNAPPEVKALPEYKPNCKKVVFKRVHWLLKPLGGCPICTTGQLALWSYLVKIIGSRTFPAITNYLQLIWTGIFVICASILLIHILKKALHD